MQIITRAVGDGALDVDDPLIERLYLSRGLTRTDDTDKGLKSLVSPLGLMDIDKAAQRVAEAVVAQQRILIIGDYDADGATSVAVSYTHLTLPTN